MKILCVLVVFGVVQKALSQNVLDIINPDKYPPIITDAASIVNMPAHIGQDIVDANFSNIIPEGIDNYIIPMLPDEEFWGKSKVTTLDFIRKEGYPCENHYVITPDGYILNVHRIPAGKTGKTNHKVAYLQHGLLASSSDWILAGPGKGLGYILADEGYDVWMGNVRGNKYSRNHTTLNPERDSEFWMFSWHEIGAIDLPTIIDYVLKQTGVDGVYYAGHSQGTTSFYVMASMVPEYNAKIKVHVSLAPIAYMSDMTSPLMQIIAKSVNQISIITKIIGMDEFLPSDGFMALMSEKMCAKGVGQVLCKNSLFAVCGFSPGQMNTTLLPTIMEQTPAGAATRQFLHYAQEINSGKFCQYDHGLMKNRRIYGTWSPPEYDLYKISAPVYLIYSENDWLAGLKDVDRLSVELGNCVSKLLVPNAEFNHLDFTFGIDAPNLVYTEVVRFFARH